MSRGLIPASGDRDNTISLVRIPHRSSLDADASIATRPTLVTIGRNAPLAGPGCLQIITIFRKTEEKYFCKRGLTFLSYASVKQN
jgi:hypothetical protein